MELELFKSESTAKQKQQRFVNTKTFQQHVTNNKPECCNGVRVSVCRCALVCVPNRWHARLAWEITSCATNFELLFIIIFLYFLVSLPLSTCLD